MDAVQFINEKVRLCKANKTCKDCPAKRERYCLFTMILHCDAKQQVEVVEEWSATHPRKTRQSVFLEQWPNARPADDGVLTFCPKRFDFHISCLAECHSLKKCSDCRREFWMQEVE